jgi:hypothetical protein
VRPEVADRSAAEDGTEDCPARVCGDECDQPVIHPPERLLGEDAKVLQQDGQLRAVESRIVRPQTDPEPSICPQEVVRCQGGLVPSHSIFD